MAGEDRNELLEQHGERRRRARDGILDALSNDGEPTPKLLLRLMLTVVEEIGDKIDAVLANERGLREAVLNGHTDVHDDHHEWVAQKIADEKQAAQDAADMARAGKKAAIEGITRWGVAVALSMAAGALGMAHFLK